VRDRPFRLGESGSARGLWLLDDLSLLGCREELFEQWLGSCNGSVPAMARFLQWLGSCNGVGLLAEDNDNRWTRALCNLYRRSMPASLSKTELPGSVRAEIAGRARVGADRHR
jgi:hypothetical protein